MMIMSDRDNLTVYISHLSSSSHHISHLLDCINPFAFSSLSKLMHAQGNVAIMSMMMMMMMMMILIAVMITMIVMMTIMMMIVTMRIIILHVIICTDVSLYVSFKSSNSHLIDDNFEQRDIVALHQLILLIFYRLVILIAHGKYCHHHPYHYHHHHIIIITIIIIIIPKSS